MKTSIIRYAGAAIMSLLAPVAMAAFFPVNTTADSGAGSLRNAINMANIDAAPNAAPLDPIIIYFNVPVGMLQPAVAGGVAVIQPLTSLPIISNIHGFGITIDGFTQSLTADAGTGPPTSIVCEVVLDGSQVRGNHVERCYIGTEIIGTTVPPNMMGNGNDGVYIGEGADHNVVDQNTIAHNGLTGVVVQDDPADPNDDDTSFNRITENAIYRNGMADPGYLGIDLAFDGVTLNDVGDSDDGPNRLMNFPVITSEFSVNHPVWDENQRDYDYGDAPDTPGVAGDYPTLLASGGARHLIVPGMYMGQSVDGEVEDYRIEVEGDIGVIGDLVWDEIFDKGNHFLFFKHTIDIPIDEAFVQQEGTIYWLDIQVNSTQIEQQWGWKTSRSAHFEDDAVWADWDGTAGAMLDWKELVDPETGLSIDFAFFIEGEEEQEDLDFGDAPDDPANPNDYPTLLGSNGARHVIANDPTGLQYRMGPAIDPEPDGRPDPGALGDDQNTLYPGVPFPPGDEDGVSFLPSSLVPNVWTVIQVDASTNGYLNAWIDFDANGDWTSIGKRINSAISISTSPLTVVLNWPPEPSATSYSVYSATTLSIAFPGAWLLETPGGTPVLTWTDTPSVPAKFYIVVAFP